MISMLGIYLTGDLIHRHYWKGFFCMVMTYSFYEDSHRLVI